MQSLKDLSVWWLKDGKLSFFMEKSIHNLFDKNKQRDFIVDRRKKKRLKELTNSTRKNVLRVNGEVGETWIVIDSRTHQCEEKIGRIGTHWTRKMLEMNCVLYILRWKYIHRFEAWNLPNSGYFRRNSCKYFKL